MSAIDTNILLYVRDPRGPAKQETASDLMQSLPDAVLLWQVACEYVAASRKLQKVGYDGDQAWRDITRLAEVWPLKLPSELVFKGAQLLSVTHSLSVWDALLLAACGEADVAIPYTEDLQHGQILGTVRVVNPFL